MAREFPCWGSALGICAAALVRAWSNRPCGSATGMTAEMYDNEREVGEGLRASGVKRNDVFIATKIWPSHFAPPELQRATRECLGRLRLGEVDLLLLHWPNPQIPLAETLGALCKVKRDGLARHIGVSNFTVSLMDEALRLSSEPLAAISSNAIPFSISRS